MFISVIIPHFNDIDRLLALLHSLMEQTLSSQNWDVIVINNDPDLPLVLPKNISFSFSLTVLEENKPGSYAARNKGVIAAKGNIIGFTDSDMLPDPNWLETAYDFFSIYKKKEIGILTGPVPMFFKNIRSLSQAEIYEKYTGFDFKGYANQGSCGAGNWFSYKAVLEEFGGFREDLKSNGDTELSLRISQKYKVVYVPELINKHPARYTVEELVFRYRRLLGGAYTRKYQGNKLEFLVYTLNFVFKRYRFSVKKFFTIPLHESWAIFKVSNAINFGALKEYFSLIRGGETKR